MTSKHTQILLSIAAVGLLVSIPSVARADLAACGGMFLSVDAQCEFRTTETCTTTCEDVAMETSCAARLYTDCETECTAVADVSCVSTCTTNLTPTCETLEDSEEPANAHGMCMSSCQQDCSNNCADAAGNKGECRSSCAQNCGEICEKRTATDESPTCEPRCTVACEGSCTARASSGCQITCQEKEFTVCKTEMVQQCKEDCDTTGGALFCDGQFLAAGELQACADELLAELAIAVNIEIEVEGKCTGDGCEGSAEAEGSGGCFSTIDARGGLGGTLMALGIVGLHLTRRRRRA